MTNDAIAKSLDNVSSSLGGPITSVNTYPWPLVPSSLASQPKSDAPFIVHTLAQLLDEGKITEDTFVRLVEKVIQRG